MADNRYRRPFDSVMVLTERDYAAVLSPDFSVLWGMPKAEQLWSTYRNRWCARFWQSQGLAVIPTISWAEPESFPFCFAGIPKGQTVAVGAFGIMGTGKRGDSARDHINRYRAGFDAMMTALEPRRVLAYGSLPFSCPIAMEFTPDWVTAKAMR